MDAEHAPLAFVPWKPRSDRIDGRAAEYRLRGFRRSLPGRVVNEPLFLERLSGRRRLASMPLSDEQIKEQISYLETRIERQRAIIDGLEAEGYGGEVIRRSRTLLKQMIADLWVRPPAWRLPFKVQLKEGLFARIRRRPSPADQNDGISDGIESIHTPLSN
jgi:hypothetical protein